MNDPKLWAVWWPNTPTSGEVVLARSHTEAAQVFVERHLAEWDARHYARKLSGTYTVKVATVSGGFLGRTPDVTVSWDVVVPVGATRPSVLRVGP